MAGYRWVLEVWGREFDSLSAGERYRARDFVTWLERNLTHPNDPSRNGGPTG